MLLKCSLEHISRRLAISAIIVRAHLVKIELKIAAIELLNAASAPGVVCLTCFLGAEQILALRFVGIDCGDRHVVRRVWLQVLQGVGCLVIVQNGLMRKAKALACRKALGKNGHFPPNRNRGRVSAITGPFKQNNLLLPCSRCDSWRNFRVAGSRSFSRSLMDVHRISRTRGF